MQPTTGQQSEKASAGLKSRTTPLKLLELSNDKNENKYDDTERFKIYQPFVKNLQSLYNPSDISTI